MTIKVERYIRLVYPNYPYAFGFWDRENRNHDAEAALLHEILDWCREQFHEAKNEGLGATPTTGGWRWDYDRPFFIFSFADEVEATAFRMRWC